MKKLTIITTILLCITLVEIQVYVSYQGVSKLKKSFKNAQNVKVVDNDKPFFDITRNISVDSFTTTFKEDSLKIEEMKLKLKKVGIGTD